MGNEWETAQIEEIAEKVALSRFAVHPDSLYPTF